MKCKYVSICKYAYSLNQDFCYFRGAPIIGSGRRNKGRNCQSATAPRDNFQDGGERLRCQTVSWPNFNVVATDLYPYILFPSNSLASGDSGDSFFRGVNLTATGRRKAADAGSALCSLNLQAIYTWDLDDSRSAGSALMACWLGLIVHKCSISDYCSAFHLLAAT